MLINFKVSNFRSIEDEIELNLVSNREPSSGDIEAKSIKANVVSRLVIYGPNAAGKTNILLAYQWLVDFSRGSLFHNPWSFLYDGIDIQPFIFRDGPGKTTSFTVELEIDGILYEYKVTLDAEKVHREELHYWPQGRRKLLFFRDDSGLKTSREFGAIKKPRELLTPSLLFLSLGRKYNLGPASEFLKHFQNISGDMSNNTEGIYSPRNAHSSNYSWYTEELGRPPLSNFSLPLEMRKPKALSLLKLADEGISDINFEYEELERPRPDGSKSKVMRRRVRLEHKISEEVRVLDLESESRGTKKWLGLISPLLTALDLGSLVLIDEMDSSLHPLLFKTVLDMFSDPYFNTKGAQLIVTSHNPSILNGLTSDEVLFTNKRQGSTEVYPLSDFLASQIAQRDKREKQYLDGRFGAVPEIDIELVKELLRNLDETAKEHAQS